MDAQFGAGGEVDDMQSQKRCNCKKAKCLKLYCVCFSAGVYCGGCACRDCMNTVQHQEAVWSERQRILQRSPRAFAPKVEHRVSGDVMHKKGCRCRKSRCLKKYCECYDAGVLCSSMCRCDDCLNQGDGPSSTQQSAQALHHAPGLVGLPKQSLTGIAPVAAGAISQAFGSKTKRRPARHSSQLTRHNSRSANSPGRQGGYRSCATTDDERPEDSLPHAPTGIMGADGVAAAAMHDTIPPACTQPSSPHMDDMGPLLDPRPTYSSASAALAHLLGSVPISRAPLVTSSSLCLGLPGSLAPSPLAMPGLDDPTLIWPSVNGTAHEMDSHMGEGAQTSQAPGMLPISAPANLGHPLTPAVQDMLDEQRDLADLSLPLLRRGTEVACVVSRTSKAAKTAATPMGPGTAISFQGPSPFSLAQPPLPTAEQITCSSMSAEPLPMMHQQPHAPGRMRNRTPDLGHHACVGAMPQHLQVNVPYLVQPHVLLSRPEAARCLAQQLGLDETHQLAALKAAQILQAMVSQASSQIQALEQEYLPGLPALGLHVQQGHIMTQANQPAQNLSHAAAQPAGTCPLEPAASASQQPAAAISAQRARMCTEHLGLLTGREDPLLASLLSAVVPVAQQQQQQLLPLQQAGSIAVDMGMPGSNNVSAVQMQAHSTSAASCPPTGSGPVMPADCNPAGHHQPQPLAGQTVPQATRQLSCTAGFNSKQASGRTSKAVRLGSGSFRFTGTAPVQLTSTGGADSQPQPAGGLLYSSLNPTRTSPAGYTTTIGGEIGRRAPTRLACMTIGTEATFTTDATTCEDSHDKMAPATSAALATYSRRVSKRARCDMTSNTRELEACSDMLPQPEAAHCQPVELDAGQSSSPMLDATASSSRALACSSDANQPDQQQKGHAGTAREGADYMDSANEVEAVQALFDLGSRVASQHPPEATATAAITYTGASDKCMACKPASLQVAQA